MSDAIHSSWTDPFSPESQAISLMRMSFGGLIPETVTREECLKLMVGFAKYESDRADAALGTLMDRHFISQPPKP